MIASRVDRGGREVLRRSSEDEGEREEVEEEEEERT